MYKHSAVTEQIIKAFYHVYNELGHGFLEKVYENAMVIQLRKQGLVVRQHAPIKVSFDGRIVGVGRTIRIESIAVHYDLVAPTEHREAIERALRVHPEGCPAHQSVKDAIKITWDAALRLGESVVEVREAD